MPHRIEDDNGKPALFLIGNPRTFQFQNSGFGSMANQRAYIAVGELSIVIPASDLLRLGK